jgi:hypothetical protein
LEAGAKLSEKIHNRQDDPDDRATIVFSVILLRLTSNSDRSLLTDLGCLPASASCISVNSKSARTKELRGLETSQMPKTRSTKTQEDRTAIQRTAKTVKESAKNIEESASSMEGTSDRSTLLAADRTVFAAERTYAAWVRTGLASLASGIGAKALLGKIVADPIVMFASSILVLFSAFLLLRGGLARTCAATA